MRLALVLILLLLVSCRSAFASVYINEFSSSADDDWVELYNSGPDSIDLSLYLLRDSTDSDSNKKEPNGVLPSGSFFSIDFSNKLNNSGDTIRLMLKSDNSLIDQVLYGSDGVSVPDTEHSVGRIPDGSDNWVILSIISKGTSNNAASAVPTPTPTPTATPTPTKVPTPTPTVKPTPTPTTSKVSVTTPTPTVAAKISTMLTATITKIPSVEASEVNNVSSGEVLGKSNYQSPTPSVEVLGARDAIFPWWPLFFVGGGGIILSCCGILGFRKWKEKQLTSDN